MWIVWILWTTYGCHIRKAPVYQHFFKILAKGTFPQFSSKNPQPEKRIESLQTVDNVDKSDSKQVFPDFMNISGPHSYQQVTGCAIFQKKIFYLIKRTEMNAMMSKL